MPDELSQRIAIYLSAYRPLLAARRRPAAMAGDELAPSNKLWVSMFGTAMADFAVYTAVSDTTRKRFGRHVNPHLFRDCAATTIALKDAANVQITPSVLGHACLSTSQRYYNHALSVRALSLHQADIIAARKGARCRKKPEKVRREKKARTK